MHNMALRPQAMVLRQPMPLRQPMVLLEDMPVEPTVALPVRPMALPLGPMAVTWPTLLAPVRRPMTFSGPPLQTSHGNGMALPAPIDAATCASRIPIPCAVMGIKRRARLPKNERHLSLILSPAARRGFFFVGRNSALIRQGERWAFSAGGDDGRKPMRGRTAKRTASHALLGARLVPRSAVVTTHFTNAVAVPPPQLRFLRSLSRQLQSLRTPHVGARS
jgi:hypothetical protein